MGLARISDQHSVCTAAPSRIVGVKNLSRNGSVEMLQTLISIGAAMLAALTTVFSAFLVYRYNNSLERVNKRRELRMKYLVEAYREIAFACNRPLSVEKMDDFRKIEQALEDIQLFGLPEQVELVREFAENFVKNSTASVDPLLFALRRTLREEFSMEPDNPPNIWHLRINEAVLVQGDAPGQGVANSRTKINLASQRADVNRNPPTTSWRPSPPTPIAADALKILLVQETTP
jgi:hypothetical protein